MKLEKALSTSPSFPLTVRRVRARFLLVWCRSVPDSFSLRPRFFLSFPIFFCLFAVMHYVFILKMVQRFALFSFRSSGQETGSLSWRTSMLFSWYASPRNGENFRTFATITLFLLFSLWSNILTRRALNAGQYRARFSVKSRISAPTRLRKYIVPGRYWFKKMTTCLLSLTDPTLPYGFRGVLLIVTSLSLWQR